MLSRVVLAIGLIVVDPDDDLLNRITSKVPAPVPFTGVSHLVPGVANRENPTARKRMDALIHVELDPEYGVDVLNQAQDASNRTENLQAV